MKQDGKSEIRDRTILRAFDSENIDSVEIETEAAAKEEKRGNYCKGAHVGRIVARMGVTRTYATIVALSICTMDDKHFLG